MGIRHLNKHLRTNCPQSIKCIHMQDLYGKKIAIDISIYLYKYHSENTLLENIYLMLSIFRHYNIIPIFIFDGKPPQEKKTLLQKRKENKNNAEQEYKHLQTLLHNQNNIDKDEKQEITIAMEKLKKQFVYINNQIIQKVKELIRAYGATYYDAPGEADALCAMLVIHNKVWACLSEDMDLFVYGCKRVLRYFSLLNHSAVLYYMKGILNELNINHNEFKEICILSGTDYNNENNNNLHNILKLFQKYKKYNNNNELPFHQWLSTNTNYNNNIQLFNKIYQIFDITTLPKTYLDITIMNGQILHNNIKEIMKEDGFLFCIKN
jgi:flap endonuclease-1